MAYVYKTVNGVRKLVNVPDAAKITETTTADPSTTVNKDTGTSNYGVLGAESGKSQQALINQLQGQAAGKSSIVSEQMKAASDKTLAQQLAAAGAARGGNQAALQRQLARNQMAQGAELTQQVGQAQLKEQQAAQQALASVIAQQQQAALAKSQQESQIEASKVSGQMGIEATKAGSIVGQIMGIFAEGGIVGKDKKSKTDEAIKEADKMHEALRKIEEMKNSKSKKYAEGGIVGDEEDEDSRKKDSAKANLKQIQEAKASRYEKSTGKKAPAMFKGDTEIREEREEKNKKEIESSDYRRSFAEGLVRFEGGTENAGKAALAKEFENEMSAPKKDKPTAMSIASDYGKGLAMGELSKDKGYQQGKQIYETGKEMYKFGKALLADSPSAGSSDSMPEGSSEAFADGGPAEGDLDASSYRRLGRVDDADSMAASKAAAGNEGIFKIGQAIASYMSGDSKSAAGNAASNAGSAIKAEDGAIVSEEAEDIEDTEDTSAAEDGADEVTEEDEKIEDEATKDYKDLGELRTPSSASEAAKAAVGNDQLHKAGKMVLNYFTAGTSSSTGADKGLSAEGAAANGGLAQALKGSRRSVAEKRNDGFGAILAAQAHLNKRMDELESKSKKRK